MAFDFESFGTPVGQAGNAPAASSAPAQKPAFNFESFGQPVAQQPKRGFLGSILPFAGGVAGELGAAALAAPTLNPAAIWAAGAAGAGAGAAAGETAQQGIENLTGERKGYSGADIAGAGENAAAWTAVGGPVASAFSKIPGVKYVAGKAVENVAKIPGVTRAATALFDAADKVAPQWMKTGAQASAEGTDYMGASIWHPVQSIKGTLPKTIAERDAIDHAAQLAKYQQQEVDKLTKFGKTPNAQDTKPMGIMNEAKARGVNIDQTLKNNNTHALDYVDEKGQLATAGAGEEYMNKARQSGELFDSALASSKGGARQEPLQNVLDEIHAEINAKVSDPVERAKMRDAATAEYNHSEVKKDYGEYGYSPLDLRTSIKNADEYVYRKPNAEGQTVVLDSLTAARKKIERDVFKRLLIKNAPKGVPVEDFLKSSEALFRTGDYLKSINGKNPILSNFQKALNVALQTTLAAGGFAAGGGVGLGGIAAGNGGRQLAGPIFDTLSRMSNPEKVAMLKKLGATEPEVYAVLRKYTAGREAEAASTENKLPAPQKSIFKVAPPSEETKAMYSEYADKQARDAAKAAKRENKMKASEEKRIGDLLKSNNPQILKFAGRMRLRNMYVQGKNTFPTGRSPDADKFIREYLAKYPKIGDN